MAERVLKKKLKERNRNDIKVPSAALFDMEGAPGDPKVAEILNKKGFDGYGHKSRLLREDMLVEADMILVLQVS